MTWLILASCVVLVVALVVRRQAHTRADALGLPGSLVYRDEGGGRDELFVSAAHQLAGRPDYILNEGGELMPVERKSRPLARSGPYAGEVLQLAAYGLLLEERFRKPVRHGQLQYLNGSLDIPLDAALRGRLLATLEAMRKAEARGDAPRSHNSPARCLGCGFRKVCRDSLAPE